MTTRLSSLQYPMLKMFVELGVDGHMSVEEAQRWNQCPFRSMLIQRWIGYRPSRGFHVTRQGIEAYHEFLSRDISRKDPSAPLTAYFDASAYQRKRRNGAK